MYTQKHAWARSILTGLCVMGMLILAQLPLMAQQRVIHGRITSAQDHSALPGVSIQIRGTSTGTVTDAHGGFTLNVEPKDTLMINYLGFERQELPVGQRSDFNLAMRPDSHQLNDLVVVGYGTARKATLTGAISSIKGSSVVKSPATNVSNSLVGRLPGLVAVQPSGEPGYDGSTIRIRGVNSLGNNSALVVVDGIPGRSLDRIDPNTIESITILKDASAAIYGSEAANGVILITTKHGQVGKPQVNLNLNYGVNQPTRIPKMADAATYATMLNEIAMYNGSPAVYTADDIKQYQDGSDPWGHPNTNWFKETLKPWSQQNQANISVSGGSESMKYFVNLGSKYQEGDYYHSATGYHQYDFTSNLDGRVNQYVKIGFDLSGRLEDRQYPTRGAGDIFRMIMRGKPNLPAYWPNGLPGPDIEYGNNPVVISTDATGYDRDKRYVLNSNMSLDIKVPWVDGLSVTGNAAIDKGFDFRKVWQTPWYLYTWDFQTRDSNGNPVLVKGKRGFDDARLTEYMQDQTNITLNALVNYQHTFHGGHDLKFMAGTESIRGNGDNFNAFRRYYTSTAIDQLFAGGTAEINNNGSAFVNARLNYFGRVNYNYKDKYLAEFVWRYDGSYIFPENHRFGFFPGISAGWRVSEEPFWKHVSSTVNNLKIRASWGQTGNDLIPEWQYLSTYAYGNPVGQPYYPFVTNGSIENQTLYETRIPNLNATWEVANQLDLGLDASLWNDKLSVTADYFDYIRSQILWTRNASIPTSTGITLPRENIGKVQNRGFDFNVTYTDHSGDFHYSISVNGGYQKNKILFWDESPGRPDYQKSTGHPIPTNPYNSDDNLYYIAIGVFHNQAEIDKYPHWPGARPGDIIFKDVNGDGKIDGNDRVRNYKTNIPTFTGGLNLNLGYKQFDVSMLWQCATGAVNYISTESGEIGDFLQSFASGRWTPTDSLSNKPRTFNRTNEYWVNNRNTYWLRSTNYLRLKTLQIGYSLPDKTCHAIGMEHVRVYVSGYNLLTYSPDYTDFDPEASAGSGQSYPLQRVVSAGLSVTF